MENHDLHHEFPQHEQKIHSMKISDTHFRKVFDEYHHVNKDIHRVETSGVYTDDEIKVLKSRRLHLKDELLSMLEKN